MVNPVLNQINKSLSQAVEKEYGALAGSVSIHFEHPAAESYGDYATNIALVIAKKLQQNPKIVAEKLSAILLEKYSHQFASIEVAGPGFINFRLSEQQLVATIAEIYSQKSKYGQSSLFSGKKFLIEHTSPNTIKTLHVGHVRNNVLGMAVKRILEFAGVQVFLDAINNDRGIHVMKANWAYLQYGRKDQSITLQAPKVSWVDLLDEWYRLEHQGGRVDSASWRKPSPGEKPDLFVDQFYTLGIQAEEKYPQAKEAMREMLRAWENKDEKVRLLWWKLRNWTFSGFRSTYKRLGSHHDKQWFENDFYEHGRETILEGLKKGVFQKLPDGAVLSNLESYQLPNTIILRSDGTTMYHTQDLYLVQLKRQEFAADLYIWDIGPEQSLYLRQLFAMCEQMGIGKRDHYFHLSYGFIYLKGEGKMSSRKGNVVSADWLMDEVVKKVKKIIKQTGDGRDLTQAQVDEVAENIAIGAIKYAMLKVSRESDISFDIDESISLEGDSGPYLQYTYARCHSVLANAKSKIRNSSASWRIEIRNFNPQELAILRWLYRFPEVVQEAAKNYAPNLICSFLYELAKRYNRFYQEHSILKAETSKQEFRLLLTSATSQVIKNGLHLMGIKTPEKM